MPLAGGVGVLAAWGAGSEWPGGLIRVRPSKPLLAAVTAAFSAVVRGTRLPPRALKPAPHAKGATENASK